MFQQVGPLTRVNLRCAVPEDGRAFPLQSPHALHLLISPHGGHALPQPMLDVVGFVTAAAGL